MLMQSSGRELLGRLVTPEEDASPAPEAADAASAPEALEDESLDLGDEELTFSPLFEIVRQATPKGVVIQAIPWGFLAFDAPVKVAPDSYADVGDLKEGDRRMLVALVRQGEELKLSLRAERGGLTLVK